MHIPGGGLKAVHFGIRCGEEKGLPEEDSIVLHKESVWILRIHAVWAGGSVPLWGGRASGAYGGAVHDPLDL